MDIYINDETKIITIQQRWKFSWQNDPGTAIWTEGEKVNIGRRIKKVIHRSWDNVFPIKVNGTSQFAVKHAKHNFKIKIDLVFTTNRPHWNVKVIKIMKTFWLKSYANWYDRYLEINTGNFKKRKLPSGEKQRAIDHEFGHLLLNDDEHVIDTEFYDDKSSMLNNGMVIRRRHFDHIISKLNQMIPNTNFYI